MSEATYEVPILAEFSPRGDITAWELAQIVTILASAPSGHHGIFTDKNWTKLGILRRHWTRLRREEESDV